MIAGEGTQVIHRSARDIYEFVLDPERYKKADLKIGTVHSVTWFGDQAEIHYSGRFRGISTPSVRQVLTAQPYRRVDVRSKPGTFAHLVSRFHGLFTFEEIGGGAGGAHGARAHAAIRRCTRFTMTASVPPVGGSPSPLEARAGGRRRAEERSGTSGGSKPGAGQTPSSVRAAVTSAGASMP